VIRAYRNAVTALMERNAKLHNDLTAANIDLDCLRTIQVCQALRKHFACLRFHSILPDPGEERFRWQNSQGATYPSFQSTHLHPVQHSSAHGPFTVHHLMLPTDGSAPGQPHLQEPSQRAPQQLVSAGSWPGTLSEQVDKGGYAHLSAGFTAGGRSELDSICTAFFQPSATHSSHVECPLTGQAGGGDDVPRTESGGTRAPVFGRMRSDEVKSEEAGWGEAGGLGWMGKVKVNLGGLCGKKRPAVGSEEAARNRRPRFWSRPEHQRFLEALEKHHRTSGAKPVEAGGRVPVGLGHGVAELIAAHVGTRTVSQVRSHAQKHFLKMSRVQQHKDGTDPMNQVRHGSPRALPVVHQDGGGRAFMQKVGRAPLIVD
jgi:hypothetical protein